MDINKKYFIFFIAFLICYAALMTGCKQQSGVVDLHEPGNQEGISENNQMSIIGGNNMKIKAGRASFQLPDDWSDRSTYLYTSSDRLWKITLLFDSEVVEPSAEAILNDRLETAQEVLPGFRIISREPVELMEKHGQVVTFDNEDVDEITRSRILVVLLEQGLALVLTCQGPANQWTELEPIWNSLIRTLRLTEK